MGAWGTGLYANDFAADLKSTVAALATLPFDGDRIADILRQESAEILADTEDADYTTFWLVVADQFEKKGICCESVRKTAVQIIESGQDLKLMAAVEMSSKDLKQRQKVLNELKSRLSEPIPPRPRKTIKAPPPLLMNVGDLFTYPVSQGSPLNPYLSNPRADDPGWNLDGWATMLIIDAGFAFDFLPWYRPITTAVMSKQPLGIEDLPSAGRWFLRNPGTASGTHLKKMELLKIAALKVNRGKIVTRFSPFKSDVSYAVNDISISNQMSVAATDAQACLQFSSCKLVGENYERKMNPSIETLQEIF